MIHSFSCHNFYSFKDLTKVDFVVNKKAPINNSYFITETGSRLSKIETVIGPNASGKTNLLKVIPFLRWFIVHSFEIDIEKNLPVKSFFYGDSEKKPTYFAVVFQIENKIYEYSVILDSKIIKKEELKVRVKNIKKTSTKKLFTREWDPINKKYKLSARNFNLPKVVDASQLQNKASLICTAARSNHKESQEIINFWRKIETNVIEIGWLGDSYSKDKGTQFYRAVNFYNNPQNKIIKERVEELLSQFDLGLNSFNIEKDEKEGEAFLRLNFNHSFGGEIKLLPFIYESSGTKQLFIILKSILSVLNNGGIIVLDEFDASLHPSIVLKIFELFIHPETNPNNAQIIFSTHNHQILNSLDKYQIILVEKNNEGVSEAWRLDEMGSEVRIDDNFYAKYIAGTYGGIPKI
ncbi:MAG: ATP-binding protein [Candidatus Pacebacteria bacterium]|nr:ATP-binding protein [Candidatus Paceibacterota bacterium]MDD2757110.1 ATP-binding protein [Candidatus Paceibacterota bacterium]MDD3283619.1 ATP-binding protein [Candidatus Paceibacterota bacterium]MDD3969758.1 ATP-binding protein [Candidatus Paceibacterota bacterium]MDD4737647.1 ATP-binding protein [Candidatus Paceibacterota bacterium]